MEKKDEILMQTQCLRESNTAQITSFQEAFQERFQQQVAHQQQQLDGMLGRQMHQFEAMLARHGHRE